RGVRDCRFFLHGSLLLVRGQTLAASALFFTCETLRNAARLYPLRGLSVPLACREGRARLWGLAMLKPSAACGVSGDVQQPLVCSPGVPAPRRPGTWAVALDTDTFTRGAHDKTAKDMGRARVIRVNI